MTKEVDLLSLGKSENSTKANANTSKKEGLSLFDSLLVNSKKNETNTSEEANLEKSTENKQNENSTKQTSSSNEQNIKQEESSTKLKNNTNNELQQKNQVLEEKSVNTKESNQTKEVLVQKENTSSLAKSEQDISKGEVKQQASTSLLDRMVLEAKKSINPTNLENATDGAKNNTLKQDGISLENKAKIQTDDIKVKDNNLKSEQTSEVKSNIETKDQIKTDIKESISTQTNDKTTSPEVKENSKNINEIKDNTKNVTSEQNIENKNTNSLNETTKTDETSSLQKDLNPKNLKEQVVEKLETATNSKENSSVNQNIDNKTSKEQVNNSEVKKVDVPNIENTTKDIDQKIDIKNIENDTKTSAINESKVNLETNNTVLEKDTKVSTGLKEQVQTTMNFDESSTSEENIKNIDSVQKEVKVETKIDNSNVNIETKNISVDDTQVSKETEVKKTDLLQENIKDSKSSTVTLDEVETVKIEENKTKNTTNNLESEKSLKTVEGNTKTSKNEAVEENIASKTDTTKTTSKEANQDFSKLDNKAFVQEEQRVNVNKESLKESSEVKPQTQVEMKEESKSGRSLMDRLLDNAKEQTVTVKNANLNNETLETQVKATQKSSDVATNIFLSSQKNSIYTQMLVNKSEGVKTVKNATSIEDVKEGAKTLDLGLEETSVEVQKASRENSVVQKITKALDSQISLLDKMAFEKNMSLDELNSKLQSQLSSTSAATASSTMTAEEAVLNMNVNTTLALNIQNRIIGAQQQMASMMSDVARNMYENYKPPVTAFRLNLFPAQLGHIAILMKNDRENSISISMNMSQSSTLDAFVENQGVLRDALNRTFENQQTSFSLDFNMEEGSNNSGNENQEDNQDKQNHSSDEIMESIIQNQDTTEDSNYM